MPKVSVILTSFNHGKYLRESIDSVLNQTFTDFELLIWDDASADDSWPIIQSYSDPRIRAFRNEVSRRGIHGVNKSITELAVGKYIAIHHSDDVWELDKLERQVSFLDSNPLIGAVFSNALAIGEDSQPLADSSHYYAGIFDKPNRSRHEWLRFFFSQGNALCHPSVLIRKQCYSDCGAYRYGMAQLADFDMWVRLCLKYEIHVLPEKLIRFRVRDNNANSSGNRADVRIRDRSEFYQVLKNYQSLDSFEDLATVFPEAEKYRRSGGCVPDFVLAMVALGEHSLLWAKFLGMDLLYGLIANEESRGRLLSLYQFDYQDFIALAGKFDLFSLEAVQHLNEEVAKLNRVIASKPGPSTRPDVGGAQASRPGCAPADSNEYEMAAQLLESGAVEQGRALLEQLAEKGSSCWEVYNDLAVQYFNEGDFDRAVPCFEKGMALEGDTGTTARNCASMLLSAGEVDAALGVWGRVLHERPQDAEILEILRQVLSGIDLIQPETWGKLVEDLRAGVYSAAMVASQNAYGGAIEETAGRKAGAPAVEIKIFQIYYNDDTRAKIDPAYIPLDNTKNERPDWVEYWPIRKVLLDQRFDDDTYLGFFSPKFFEKTGLRGKQVLEFVRDCDDEVISFSPFFDQGAIHTNPFAQGEVNHPGLLEVTRKVLKFLQVDIVPESLVCDQTTTIFSNYFVARYSFWKKWFAYAEKIIEVCEGPDCELKTDLLRTTTYRKGTNYAMKIFILERLVTVVLEELGIRSRIGMDFTKTPTLLPGARENLVGLVICDALKGQYRRTGLPIYLDTLLKVRGI